MLFNSVPFLALVTATFGAVRLMPGIGWLVLLASAIFYGFAGPRDSLLFLAMIAANWAVSFAPPRARLWLAALVNIGVLAFLKYRDFLTGGEATAGSFVDVALPLGISFYTFQMMAYHVDLARGVTRRASGLPQFATFVAFFPQLIAGPIVRAHQLLPQVERLFAGYRRRLRLLTFGLGLICLGLIKKIVFADSLAPIVDDLFAMPPDSVFDAWLAAWLFGFQIYFDFSGYSDIGVGAAYLLGIRLPFNFATPYLSAGPREFWQRWHITLSEWIRDYLYIPLGGSRGGALRSTAVLLAVMALAGLWHGANLTFLVWGAAWGAYIAMTRLVPDRMRLPGWISWFPHMLVVMALWVFFRAPGIEAALNHLGAMSGLSGLPLFQTVEVGSAGLGLAASGCAALMLLHAGEYFLRRTEMIAVLRRVNGPVAWSFLATVSVLLVLLPHGESNPFIYFRF
ncbi:MAG: MBOAT family protein [Hyphomicrobiales bacterium]